MDSYSLFDNIQVEKANAIARYNRFNNISKLFKIIEVFVIAALISWSSTRLPTVFKSSIEYLYACSYYILNQHVIFLVGNFIVIVCYFLSRDTQISNDSVTDSVSDSVTGSVTPETSGGDGNRYKYATTSDENKITESGSVVEPVQLPVHDFTEDAAVCDVNRIVVKTEVEKIKKAEKQIEKFKRTQSEKLKRDISMRTRRELRRSVTERRRGGGEVAEERRKSDGDSSVDSLSNEEFRLAVEAFILKQQSFIKQQSMVEN
ncbi:uncharacterized protein [Rutidosis leptorrhynchoides]|uniref:uncharacterized protein n=1 Tax=Rutidosis leptorrhynchoides TaxID=125765 RepID=UPI003A99BB1F